MSQERVGVVCAPFENDPIEVLRPFPRLSVFVPHLFLTVFHHLRLELRGFQVLEGDLSQSGASMSQVRIGVVCVPFENDPIEFYVLSLDFLSSYLTYFQRFSIIYA